VPKHLALQSVDLFEKCLRETCRLTSITYETNLAQMWKPQAFAQLIFYAIDQF